LLGYLKNKMKKLNGTNREFITEDMTSTIFRELQMPVVDNPSCQLQYTSKKTVLSSHLCAGGKKGEDACTVSDVTQYWP
jgi:hypothetical protein